MAKHYDYNPNVKVIISGDGRVVKVVERAFAEDYDSNDFLRDYENAFDGYEYGFMEHPAQQHQRSFTDHRNHSDLMN